MRKRLTEFFFLDHRSRCTPLNLWLVLNTKSLQKMYDLVQVNYCMCVPHYQILKRNGAIINAEVNNAILIYDLDGIIIRSCSLSCKALHRIGLCTTWIFLSFTRMGACIGLERLKPV